LKRPLHFSSMEYSLERLKIEQIVVTERYVSDTSQWDKLRSFWHPDSWQTNLKISWFNGTIDQYITELRTTDGINPQMKKKTKHVMGLSKHIVHPVDVTSTHLPFFLLLKFKSVAHASSW
jgi:hypothetical protein